MDAAQSMLLQDPGLLATLRNTSYLSVSPALHSTLPGSWSSGRARQLQCNTPPGL